MVRAKVIPKDELVEAINSCANSIDMTWDVVRKLKTSIVVLKKNCKIHNIPYPSTRYVCDEDFFSNINEQSMYWAGFLSADGNLRMRKSTTYDIKLELATKDIAHIELFKKHIKSNAIVKSFTRKPSPLLLKNKSVKEQYFASYLIMRSKKAFDDLGRFGITPQKTYSYTMPQWLVEHELVRHFIRGYMDGDGSYSFNKRNEQPYSIHIGLVGACPAVEQIYNIINKNCFIEYGWINSIDEKLRSFAFNSLADVKNIYNYIYGDSTVYLERKKIIIDQIDNLIEKSSMHFLDSNTVQKLYDELKSFNKVSKILNCDRATVRKFMHDNNLIYKSFPNMNRK
jgi:intein-encoded DNA endonuclease-like protein